MLLRDATIRVGSPHDGSRLDGDHSPPGAPSSLCARDVLLLSGACRPLLRLFVLLLLLPFALVVLLLLLLLLQRLQLQRLGERLCPPLRMPRWPP